MKYFVFTVSLVIYEVNVRLSVFILSSWSLLLLSKAVMFSLSFKTIFLFFILSPVALHGEFFQLYQVLPLSCTAVCVVHILVAQLCLMSCLYFVLSQTVFTESNYERWSWAEYVVQESLPYLCVVGTQALYTDTVILIKRVRLPYQYVSISLV